ncbi:hypothetical protein [Halobellus ordinarius]|uniref:hypothetical protein n=1 Tax=Halobellus ordinarius TaxID=3075120 RepID=UPI002880BD9E|nr:hypothetical protein [Halobellus sp. ZY16]
MSAALLAASGCTTLNSSGRESDPHWVKVYLGDRDETHNVTITITDQNGTTVFENEYALSESNEANENATFPASTDPETIVITVDGTRFERDWPGFEQSELPCDDANEAGIEVYIENAQDGTPEIRLEADCQSITAE